MKTFALAALALFSFEVIAIDFKLICPVLANKTWAEIIFGATEFNATLLGKNSGVLNDKGTRKFFEKNIPDCGDGRYGLTFRFTQDRVGERGVYEVFIKSQSTHEVIGVAMNNLGQEIRIVPPEVATDKNGIYGEKVTDRRIFGRDGCFRCHGNAEDTVSYTFGVKGAEEFWGKSKPVTYFEEERAVEIAKKKKQEDNAEYECEFDFKKTILSTNVVKTGVRRGSPIKGLEVALRVACHACSVGPNSEYDPPPTDTVCINPKCIEYSARPKQEVEQSRIDELMKKNDCYNDKFKKEPARKVAPVG